MLFLEDQPADAELVMHALRRAGLDPHGPRVDNEADYVAALHEDLEVILADFTLPQFDALQALRLLQGRGLDIPFIVITGSISEEIAAQCIREGAADYLLKDRLARLGQAITRALDEKALREEKRRTEIALRQSEARFRTLAETSTAGIIIVQGEHLVYANPAVEALSGYTPTELTQMRYWELIVPEMRPRVVRQSQKFTTENLTSARTEIEIVDRHGQKRWLDLSAASIEVEGAPALLATIMDITERKAAEAALRQSEEQFRAIFHESLDVIMIINGDTGEVLKVNPAVSRILGYQPEALVGQHFGVLIPPETGYKAEEFLQKLRVQGAVFEELFFQRADATLCPMDLTATVIPWGASVAVLVTFRDVTERSQRERELEAIVAVNTVMRSALRDFSTRAAILPTVLQQVTGILHAAGAALVAASVNGDPFRVELAIGDWSGCTGRTLSAEGGISHQVLESGQPYVNNDTLEERLTDLDTGGLDAAACVPLFTQDQALGVLWVGREAPFRREDVRLLAVIGDIVANTLQRVDALETLERRVAERTAELAAANERLKELDRMRSKFVSDVSHELRTPVTNLGMYLYLLEREDSAKRVNYMNLLHKQVARLKSLIENILDLSRLELAGDSADFAPLDLNTVVEPVLATHTARAEALGLALRFEAADSISCVYGDRERLAQVVENLVANAISYTPAGSVIIRTYRRSDEQYICLEVQDTGMGISPEDRPHIFERFFRGQNVSKAHIPGTGLGLVITKEIVELHRGEIEIDSELGVGTTFRVLLPAARCT